MDFKAGIYDASGSGITGSSDLGVKIKRDADDYFYDFNDDTFKPSGWVSISGTLTEVDATIVPGEYEVNEDVSGWDDGVYTAYFQYAGISAWTDAEEFRVYSGKDISEAIEDDTSELQTDLTDGGRLDLIMDAIKLQTDDLADGGRLDLIFDAISGIVHDWDDGERLDLLLDAIKAKSDNLNFNSDGTPLVLADVRDVNDTAVASIDEFKADVLSLATSGNLDAVSGNVDVLLTRIPSEVASSANLQTVDNNIDTLLVRVPEEVASSGNLQVVDDNVDTLLVRIPSEVASSGNLDDIETIVVAISGDLTAISGDLANHYTALSTHDTDIKALEPHGTPMRGTDNAAPSGTALSNVVWTDERAGYLDNVSGHTPQSGDNYPIVNHASYGNAQLVRSTTPANTLDVDASSRAAAKVEAIDADTITLSSVADTLIEALSRYGYVDRSITKASAAVGAQNITSDMATAGCIQYETIKVSKTRDWSSPDITYYLLWHYDADGDVDEVKPDTDTTW